MKEKITEIIAFLKKRKVDYGDIRIVQCSQESIDVKDTNVEGLSQRYDAGAGIRVICNGGWGFAATSVLTIAELRKTARRAIDIARASAVTAKEPVRLAPVTPYVDSYRSKYKIDPFEVPLDEKIALLLAATEVLKKHKTIAVAEGSMKFFRTRKFFGSTEGALIDQEIVESGAGIIATALEKGEVQRRSYPGSHGGDYACRGYEFVTGMDLVGNAERVREEALALLKAEPCPAAETVVIIGGAQLALQVHESCGHPIELDRVLGTEISLAGGSFLTLDKQHKLQYGSKVVSITADATIEGALGSFGYDDEGVKAQRSPVVDRGLFVGYLTSRETAPVIGETSNGTMRADGWNRIPLIRMTNINLEPGEGDLESLIADTKQGIFLDMNKSWSIDDRRLNFQFGVEVGWEIKNGKLSRMFKDCVYTGITPEFWNTCDAVCGRSEWHVWGVPNCGKGEPMQTAHVAHGTAPARFTKVRVGVSK